MTLHLSLLLLEMSNLVLHAHGIFHNKNEMLGIEHYFT